jgi:hypothetical protein
MDIDPLKSPFVPGALGALVALKGAPGASWGERIINVGCGALIAGFVAPAAAEWFGLASPEMRSAIAFMLGLFGMSLVAAITESIRSGTLTELLRGLFGRRG